MFRDGALLDCRASGLLIGIAIPTARGWGLEVGIREAAVVGF